MIKESLSSTWVGFKYLYRISFEKYKKKRIHFYFLLINMCIIKFVSNDVPPEPHPCRVHQVSSPSAHCPSAGGSRSSHTSRTRTSGMPWRSSQWPWGRPLQRVAWSARRRLWSRNHESVLAVLFADLSNCTRVTKYYWGKCRFERLRDVRPL